MPGPFGAFNLVVTGDRADAAQPRMAQRGSHAIEPSCIEVLAIIQCYVDCECDVDTMLVIAAHLDCCPGCCDELASIRWLKAAVRRCSGAPESPLWH